MQRPGNERHKQGGSQGPLSLGASQTMLGIGKKVLPQAQPPRGHGAARQTPRESDKAVFVWLTVEGKHTAQSHPTATTTTIPSC